MVSSRPKWTVLAAAGAPASLARPIHRGLLPLSVCRPGRAAWAGVAPRTETTAAPRVTTAVTRYLRVDGINMQMSPYLTPLCEAVGPTQLRSIDGVKICDG